MSSSMISTVTNGSLRTIVFVNVIPGSLVVAALLPLLVWGSFPDIQALRAMQTVEWILLLIAATIIGLAMEECGSFIEVYVVDSAVERYLRYQAAEGEEESNVYQIWLDYLKLELSEDVVGRSFIRDRLARYKFVLVMMPVVLVLTVLGIVYATMGLIASAFGYWIVPIAIVLVTALYHAAFGAALGLHQARVQLVASYRRHNE